MSITYRNRRARIVQLPTVEQPKPDAYSTHENETQVLDVEVHYNDGNWGGFGRTPARGYYLYVGVKTIEQHDGYSMERFVLFGSGRSALITEAARFSQKQLEKHAQNVAGSGLVKTLVGDVLGMCNVSLPPSPELADLFAATCGAGVTVDAAGIITGVK